MTAVDPGTLPVLRRGSSGEYVTYLQRLLVAAEEYGPSRVHGDFDLETEDAVKNFQERQGLDVDGIVGQDTWPQLVPLWTPPPAEEPEVEIDMPPMEIGPTLGRLPTAEDAEAGRSVLEDSMAASARKAANGYAELILGAGPDWEPNEAGIEMLTQLWDTVSALKEGPIEFFKEVAVTTTQFVIDFFMDGAHAKYQGEAQRVRKEFYEAAANGAASALTGTEWTAEGDQLLAAASVEAWHRMSALTPADQQRISALAILVGHGYLPRTWEEWDGVFLPSWVSGGLWELLWASED